MITINPSPFTYVDVFTASHDDMHVFVVLSNSGDFQISKPGLGVYPIVPAVQNYLGTNSFVLYMESGWTLQYKGGIVNILGGRINDEVWPS